MLLVKENQSQVIILKGKEDSLSAEKIASALRIKAPEIQVIDVCKQKGKLPSKIPIIVGSRESNPLVKDFLEKTGLMSEYQSLTGEGYLLKTFDNKLLVIGKGRVGTLYAVSELKNFHLNYGERDISIPELNVIESPVLKYRWFWNWDSRTHWIPAANRKILSRHANSFSPHPYENGSEIFIEDFKAVIDFAAEHRINGIVIWGFLRDEHGGVKVAQEMCQFAKERGVRIMPGIGPNQYNGFYYSGQHKFNSITWTKNRPNLRALGPVPGFEKAEPIPTTLCLLKRENQLWLREGVNWMYDTFDIGGFEVQTSEGWVCNCEDHKRWLEGNHISGDIELATRIVMEEVRKRDPGAWVCWDTYDDLGTYPEEKINRANQVIPDTIVLWMERIRAKAKGKYPGKKNALIFNWAPRGFESGYQPLQWYKKSIQNAWENGVEGVQIFGEGGSYLAGFEMIYLVFAALAWNPKQRLEDIVREQLSNRWGGRKAAESLLEIIPQIETDPKSAYKLAEKNAVCSEEGPTKRWSQLLSYIKGKIL